MWNYFNESGLRQSTTGRNVGSRKYGLSYRYGTCTWCKHERWDSTDPSRPDIPVHMPLLSVYTQSSQLSGTDCETPVWANKFAISNGSCEGPAVCLGARVGAPAKKQREICQNLSIFLNEDSTFFFGLKYLVKCAKHIPNIYTVYTVSALINFLYLKILLLGYLKSEITIFWVTEIDKIPSEIRPIPTNV